MSTPEGEYPPLVAKLLKLYDGSPGRAERAASVSAGLFSKIRRGSEKFTPFVQAKVLAAIEWKEKNMTAPDQPKDKAPKSHKPNDALSVPEACPPLLADLIRHCGSLKRVLEVLGTSDGSFYAVKNGSRPMPPAWEVRARAELGLSIIGNAAREEIEQQQHPEGQPPIPPFVLWDGKLTPCQTRGFGGNEGKVLKMPTPLAQLIEKYEGNRTRAAASMGRSIGYLQPFIDDPKNKFKERQQRAVHAALYGVPPAAEQTMGEDYDKYSLSLAICMVPGGNFDRIHDIADILNGRLVFKKNTKAGGWLLIYRMATEDLSKFKRLALRDANEIVCP